MGVGSFHFPNFSRHPSDAVGSYSARYMNSIVNLRGTIQPRFAYFSFIFNEYANGQINDPLAWSNTLQTNTPTRIMELGAIAPDLFDANYYSVIPNYTSVVLPKLRANRGALGIPDNLALQGDLGSHGNSFQADIHYQFQTAKPLHAPDAFFYLEDFRHLLTGWVTNSYNNYRNMFPSTKFGRCSAADTGPGTNYQPKFKIPNSCLQGGRSGYSVKMVSKDFLTSELQDVSGTKGQTGSLENPPPADF